MLNHPKHSWRIALGTITVLALLGIVGVVSKKKMATHSNGAPDSAATPDSATAPDSVAVPGAAVPGTHEPGTEPSNSGDTEVAERPARGTRQGMVVHAQGSAHAQGNPSLPSGGAQNLAMLTPTEREHAQANAFSEGGQPAGQANAKPQTPQAKDMSQPSLPPYPATPGQPLVLYQPGMPIAPEGPLVQAQGQSQGQGEGQSQSQGQSQGQGQGMTPGAPGQPLALAKPEPAQDACYTVTYHHKHPGMHAGDETCTHHKNLIRIHAAEGLKFNPKTVCIRVNGTPVKFTQNKGKPNEFIFGVVVGVETAVTARYCTGKFRCNESCAVPKDEFVEAIGGSDLDSDESKKLEVAVWDKEDPTDNNKDKEANAKLAGDMHKGLKDLDEVAKAAAEGYTLFQDWTPENQTLACQNHQALGDALPSEDEDAPQGAHRKVASKH